MEHYLNVFIQSTKNYGNYLWSEITHPAWNNYFYWLLALSVFVWILELVVPWRKDQKPFRKDFWLDFFYMFFNFFLFSLIVFEGISNIVVDIFNSGLAQFGIENLLAINLAKLPYPIYLALMFIIADFIQWNVHRLLHRYDWLWQFHKVHHSVKEMGFAAHLRFHWMESVVYKSIQYIPLAMLGYGLEELFIIHIIAISIGHINHANLGWDYGPLKYILNNPKMHIWHHVKELPTERQYGVNFGLSLSIWDYIFKTNYIPKNGRNIELGFPEDETFPKSFWKQISFPWSKRK